MERIRADFISKYNPCEYQLSRFIELFGDEAEVTLENCIRASQADLDLWWFANIPSVDCGEEFSDLETDVYNRYHNRCERIYEAHTRGEFSTTVRSEKIAKASESYSKSVGKVFFKVISKVELKAETGA